MIYVDTWDEVTNYLASSYVATGARTADEITVTVAVGEKVCGVRVRPVQVDGRPWLEIAAEVGKAWFVPPHLLLTRTFNAAVGAAYVDGSTIMVRQLLPTTGLLLEDLDDALEALAGLALLGARSEYVAYADE